MKNFLALTSNLPTAVSTSSQSTAMLSAGKVQLKATRESLMLEQYAWVVKLMEQRLGLMPYVAAYKYVHQLPIKNLSREILVLQKSMEEAEQCGLNPLSVLPLVEHQMAVAKKIQQHWLAEWAQRENAELPYRDLIHDLRPKITKLDNELLYAIRNMAPWNFSETEREMIKSFFMNRLNITGITDYQRLRIFQLLIKIRPNAR